MTRSFEIAWFPCRGIHGIVDQNVFGILRDFKNDNLDMLLQLTLRFVNLYFRCYTHVYNYDIPQDPESYVHRIRRTGRARRIKVDPILSFLQTKWDTAIIENLTKKRERKVQTCSSRRSLQAKEKVTLKRKLNVIFARMETIRNNFDKIRGCG